MSRVISASLCALLAMSCGPEAPDEPEAPGVLEYEAYGIRLYRLGRRIDAFYVRFEGDVEHHECGMMSERAYDELEETLSALEPEGEYGCDPDARECYLASRIHVAGFEHSPFACGEAVTIAGLDEPPYVCEFVCCRPGLARAALIYWLIGSYFDGYEDPLVFDGEPYVVIEPDEPCPPIESQGP